MILGLNSSTLLQVAYLAAIRLGSRQVVGHDRLDRLVDITELNAPSTATSSFHCPSDYRQLRVTVGVEDYQV